MNRLRLIIVSVGAILMLVGILVYSFDSNDALTGQDVEIFAVKSFTIVDIGANHAFLNGESVQFQIDFLASRPDIYLRLVIPHEVRLVESDLVNQSEDDAIHIRSEEMPQLEGNVFYFEPNQENSSLLTLQGQSKGRHKIRLEVYARRPGLPDDLLEIRNQYFCSASTLDSSAEMCEN